MATHAQNEVDRGTSLDRVFIGILVLFVAPILIGSVVLSYLELDKLGGMNEAPTFTTISLAGVLPWAGGLMIAIGALELVFSRVFGSWKWSARIVGLVYLILGVRNLLIGFGLLG